MSGAAYVAPDVLSWENMKRILLILTGGTICTALNEQNTLSVNDKAASQLKINFENSDSFYADKVRIDSTDNLYILSENMTVEKWNVIYKTYLEYVKKERYDGVIFAHGTDTLAFSASLFSIILSGTDIPIFFVSSNKRLDLPQANGNDNFRCAVESICRGIAPGVYVSYKNISDGQMYIHIASRLMQCENYSDDFHSVGELNVTDMTEENYHSYFDEIESKFSSECKFMVTDFELKNNVLLLQPYVGLNYGAIDYSRFSAVLHGTYHSGTACVEDTENHGENSLLAMIDYCAESGVDVYLSPSRAEGEIYDTVRVAYEYGAKKRNVRFLYGCTEETTYAKLLIAYSLFTDKKDINEFMYTEFNCEKIY